MELQKVRLVHTVGGDITCHLIPEHGLLLRHFLSARATAIIMETSKTIPAAPTATPIPIAGGEHTLQCYDARAGMELCMSNCTSFH